MTMREKINKALRDTWADFNTGYYPSVGQMDIMTDAVLEALSEPTEGMLVDVGPMEGFDCYAYEDDVDRPHLEWWRAMIRAAKEGK